MYRMSSRRLADRGIRAKQIMKSVLRNNQSISVTARLDNLYDFLFRSSYLMYERKSNHILLSRICGVIWNRFTIMINCLDEL